MKQYVQTDLEADRQVANTLAELILGGALTSALITQDGTRGQADNTDTSQPDEAA
jgi:hypothetical protein